MNPSAKATIQRPPFASVDGLDLSTFVLGQEYEIGHTVGALFLAEGWAQPADSLAEPAVGRVSKDASPPDPKREFFPPYYQGPDAVTGDRPPKSRRRSNDDET